MARPARGLEKRERQLISLAVDLVEKRLREGTATSQETTHFLKLASTKHRLETSKMEHEVELLKAKTAAIEAEKEHEISYKQVLAALQRYNGVDITDGDEDEEEL